MLPSLIASVLATIALASSGGGVSSYPQPEEPIRVLSVSHEVQFPNKIVLELETEGDSRITQVTLFYHLGGQTVLSFGYPSFAPAHRVSADFTIKTSGTHYLPSGVDIEYYYVIRDADGNTFETDRYHLEYLDPRFEWRELRLDNIRVLYHDRPDDRVLRIATDVEKRLAPVRALLDLESARPVKAVLLNDGRESRRTFPFISETARREHLFGGFAFDQYDLFVLVGLWPDGMVHEMTHLLIDQAVDSPLAKIPAWLNEGLAMYFESGPRSPSTTLERAARRGRLMPLRSMGSVPGRPFDVAMFYDQSRDVVRYMMNVHGKQKMAALLRAINEGKRIEKAVFAAYAMSLEELERDSRARLLGEPLSTEGTGPGAMGLEVSEGDAPSSVLPSAQADEIDVSSSVIPSAQADENDDPSSTLPGVQAAEQPDRRSIGMTVIITGAVAMAIMAAAVRWVRKGFWPPWARTGRP